MYAHRIAYELAYENPDILKVCHTCDNPHAAIRVSLWLGTDLDNNRDREAKNRGNQPSGENHPRCKLSDMQVAEITRKMAHGRFKS